MKNMCIRKYIAVTAIVIFLGTILNGCTNDYEPLDTTVDKDVVLFHLNLDIPGLSLSTRAMNDSQETAIDYNSIQVLVFEETKSGDVFRYKATITNQTPPTITVKVPTGRASEKYRVVVIVNMPNQTIADGTAKNTVLNQYVFACARKWNASSSGSTKIPMWGESINSFAITKDRSVSVLLHRALARVDVGTLFKFNNVNPSNGQEYENKDTDKESVWGLDNFKIKDIRAYRTRSSAYAASSEVKMTGNEVTTPNVPPTAQYNTDGGTPVATLPEADANPLLYTLAVGADSYLREIYIPESPAIDAQTNLDNVTCLVVGGYYGVGNTSKVTYYRADFATYSNGAVVSYRSILRNHRYVFDIRSVSDPGAETPEEALNTVNSGIILNVVEWNEVPLNFYSNKHYYFDIDSRTVVLEAQAQGGATENSKTISFSTDLDLNGLTSNKSIAYEWETGGVFDVDIDYANQKIKLIALSDNVGPTATPRSDVLVISVEDVVLTIYVFQEAFNLEYTLDCSSVEIQGKYIEGTILGYSHYIYLKVKSANNLNGGHYEIKTIEKNSIYFIAEGNFDNGTYINGGYEYALKLQGYGTLVNQSGNSALPSFDVSIVTNSTNNTSCTATVTVGYKTKKILTIGANAVYRYGYMLEPNTASRAFIDASINFGSNPGSSVTMAQDQYGNAFTIEVMTNGSGMSGEVINYSYLLDKLNTFQPDIILTGQAINYYTAGNSTNVIMLLNSFVDAGGVLIMCNEYYPDIASVNAMVSQIMGGAVVGTNQSIRYNQLFSLASGAGYENDMILKGPFGDMSGKTWGADGHEMYGFTGLPSGTIVYSQRSDGGVCMFRHQSKGFFFVGEGGFISNSQRYIGGSYQGSYVYCPFAIDTQYKPIPRTNYTINQSETVYNSQIFGNIMVWAVEYSERNGITYQAGVNKF